MIPENCLDCMSRQAAINPMGTMNYGQPMMGGVYQQGMTMPFAGQPYSQMAYPMQAQAPEPFGMQMPGQMQFGPGAQSFPQGMTMQPMGQMPFDTSMQQGMGMQPMQQFPQDMGGMGGQQMPMMQLGEGGPSLGVEPGPPVITDTMYTQGYLKTKIGSRVKIEFLIGTNMLIDREGTLTDVGISYVIIREVETDDLLLCDIYSIKFVRFYY
jgi:hypothetical protein